MLDTSIGQNQVMTNSKELWDYIHGGKGVITLYAPAPSQTHHSYLFSSPADRDEFPDDVIFVYAIHENKRFYIGMLEQKSFRLTRRSRFHRDTDIVRGAYYIVRMALDQNALSRTPMILYNNGRCAVCGRKLEDEKYIKIGIGRKCFKNHVENRSRVI